MRSEEKKKVFYNVRSFLNTPESPSTGNICCFDGMTTYDDDKTFRNMFCSISDCHVSARLHKTDDDTIDDFINKLKLLESNIRLFRIHLEKNKDLNF